MSRQVCVFLGKNACPNSHTCREIVKCICAAARELCVFRCAASAAHFFIHRKGIIMKKRALSLLLTLALLCAFLSHTAVPVSAETYSGYCGNLTWTLDTSTGVLTISGDGTMTTYGSGSSPWHSYRTYIKTVCFQGNVENIGSNAFYDCSALESITIPDSVKWIDSYAFSKCTSLTNVTIPESVISIGASSFEYCSSLTSVTIPDSITSIPAQTFLDCSALSQISIPNCVTSIGRAAFYGCSSLTDIVIPENITIINEYTFHGCTALETFTVPNNVTSIGNYAFFHCSGLTSVTISDSVTSIGTGAFDRCIELTLRCNCNNTFIPNYASENSIPYALIHDWEEPSYTWSSDYLTASAFHVCQRSGTHTECETVATTAEYSGPPPCTEPGELVYTAAFTKEGFTTQTKTVIVDPIGHDWGLPTYAWSEDNLTVTAVRVCHNNGAHQETETVFTTAEIIHPVTCTEPEVTTYTAVFENSAFTVQTKTIETLSPLGHDLFDPTYTWAEDNSTCVASATCSICGPIKETAIPTVTTVNTSSATLTAEFAPYSFEAQNKTVSVCDYGTCGRVYWLFDNDNHVLFVYGTGKMSYYVDPPWLDHQDQIVTAVICPGVENVLFHAFAFCEAMESAVISNSVGYIGDSSFDDCTSLKQIFLPSSVRTVYEYAFSGCPLEDVYYSGDESQWSSIAFQDGNGSLTNAIRIHYSTTDVLGHWSFISESSPTCTENGKAYYICDCGLSKSVITVPALGHDLESLPAIAPTCTEAGLTEGWACTRCDYVIPQEPVDALDHDYTDGVCSRCGEADPHYADADLTVSGVCQFVHPGEIFTVSVPVHGGEEIAGFTFMVSTNEIIRLTKIEKGAILRDVEGTLTKNLNQGLVNWTGIAPVTGEGELLILTYTVSEDAEPGGSFPMTLRLRDNKPSNIANQTGVPISTSFEDGIFVVTTVLFGDTNSDLDIDSSDAVRLARSLVDLEELTKAQAESADVNHDNDVTSSDAILLARYLAGFIDSLDVFTISRRGLMGAPDTGATIAALGTEAAPGDTVTIPFTITGNPGFAGFTIQIEAPEGFELTGIQKGTLLNASDSGAFLGNVDKGLVNWNDVENLTGNGELFLLTFHISEQVTSENNSIRLTLRDGKAKNFVNEDGEPVAVEFLSCNIIIEGAATNPFADVIEGKYYYSPVLWAYYHDPQITSGTSDTTFSPNATCTRAQIVTFLWRAAGSPEPTTTNNPFTDVKDSKYYYKAVSGYRF